MSALESINEISGNLQGYLKEQKKKSGKKFMGVMHPVVPQEVIYAAGLHPFRLFPLIREPISTGHTQLHVYTSSIFRAVWDQAVKEQYPFMDGVVLPESCETVTFFAPGWRWNRPHDFVATFCARPFRKTQTEIKFFSQEIARLVRQLEAFSGTHITDDSIQKAISLYNRNRELLRKVHGLRKSEHPPLSGTDAFKINLASLVMDKEENNAMLEKLLEEIRGKEPLPKPTARLMVSGPCLTDTRLFESMESSGAVVVVDDTNTGSRSYGHAVDSNGDLYSSLAEGYAHISCPFSTSVEERLDLISGMMKAFSVDGIVFAVEKWCESETMDFPYLEKQIPQKTGKPVLFVETEYLCDMAPIRTRVDAFVESITR